MSCAESTVNAPCHGLFHRLRVPLSPAHQPMSSVLTRVKARSPAQVAHESLLVDFGVEDRYGTVLLVAATIDRDVLQVLAQIDTGGPAKSLHALAGSGQLQSAIDDLLRYDSAADRTQVHMHQPLGLGRNLCAIQGFGGSAGSQPHHQRQNHPAGSHGFVHLNHVHHVKTRWHTPLLGYTARATNRLLPRNHFPFAAVKIYGIMTGPRS